jgi:hypothetical protein
VQENREQGMLANRLLRNEMCQYTQMYGQSEEMAQKEIETVRSAAVFWHEESEQQMQMINQNSERFLDAMHHQREVEQSLRQQLHAGNSSTGQSDHETLRRVEQEALEHVRGTEMSAQTCIAQLEKDNRLLNEELYSKNTAIQMANLHGQQVQTEVARIEQLLAQERETSRASTQGWTTSHADAVTSQQDYVQALWRSNASLSGRVHSVP